MKPALSAKVRLRWDTRACAFMLIAPERGLVLDEPAARVAKLCDGTRTIEEIAGVLANEYDGDVAQIAHDVEYFLGQLAMRGLLRVDP